MEQQTAADRTRRALLQAAQAEFHHNGFQGASLAHILHEAGVSRGGMYHHFAGKRQLGYAVVEELIGGWIQQWRDELLAADDPVAALVDWLREAPSEGSIQYGCPLNNLALEMSPLDEGFRERIRGVFAAWEEAIAAALERSRALGLLHEGVDPGREARFLLASFEGGLGLAKNQQSVGRLAEHVELLIAHLEGLRF